MDSHEPFDVFMQECPSREIMQRLGDKWTPLVLLALAGGPQRFSALRERIGAVTPKVLTNTQVPVRVDYELTDLGQGIMEPMEILRLWSEEHVPKVLAARERFDARG